MNISAPLCKVKNTEEGGREIYGLATVECVDKSGEIADAKGTIKAFGVWSDEISKRTNGLSKGNVRYMHQNITAGKMTSYQPVETTIKDNNGNDQMVKAIYVGCYVPPTKIDIISDIDNGILNSFSIAGKYAKRWWDATAKAFRYIPELAEFSLVDNPCCPGSDFTEVISKSHGPWENDNSKLNKEAEELMDKELKKEEEKKVVEKKAEVVEKVEAVEKKAEIVEKAEVIEKVDPKEEIEKACKVLGISAEQFGAIKSILNKVIDPSEPPAPVDCTTLDGTAGTFGSDGPVIDIAGGQDDIVTAENDTFKALIADMKKGIETLENDSKEVKKVGVAISASRTNNLMHAKNHIDAAINGTTYGPAQHDAAESGDDNNEEEAPVADDDTSKVMMGDLQKGIDGVTELSKVFNANLLKNENKIEALFKGVATAENFTKMADKLEEALKLVKEIHETPVSNNTILNGGSPNLLKMIKQNGSYDLKSTEDDVLQKVLSETKDAMVKDRLGQEIAMRKMKQNLNGQGVK
jgi:hypothetical protein